MNLAECIIVANIATFIFIGICTLFGVESGYFISEPLMAVSCITIWGLTLGILIKTNLRRPRP